MTVWPLDSLASHPLVGSADEEDPCVCVCAPVTPVDRGGFYMFFLQKGPWDLGRCENPMAMDMYMYNVYMNVSKKSETYAQGPSYESRVYRARAAAAKRSWAASRERGRGLRAEAEGGAAPCPVSLLLRGVPTILAHPRYCCTSCQSTFISHPEATNMAAMGQRCSTSSPSFRTSSPLTIEPRGTTTRATPSKCVSIGETGCGAVMGSASAPRSSLRAITPSHSMDSIRLYGRGHRYRAT